MILTLEVSAPQATKLGSASRKIFGASGGSIGRENDCSWVLPDVKVSGHHALVSYRDGVFYIQDRSRNGVCLNSSKNRLERDRPYALRSGDRIFIDPYEIQVSVAAEPGERRPFADQSLDVPFGGSDPFGADDPFVQHRTPLSMSSKPDLDSEVMPGEELDPLKLLGAAPKLAPVRSAPSARDLEVGVPLDAHYRPPAVLSTPAATPRSELIPQGYDPLAPDDPPAMSLPPPLPGGQEANIPAVREWPAPPRIVPPAIAPPANAPPANAPPAIAPPSVASPPIALVQGSAPAIPPARPADAAQSPDTPAVDTVVSGCRAGRGRSDRSAVTPELSRTFGRILRVVVAGVMDVLRARQQIKDEFRMRMTRFRVADNNPLKFSANVDDALHNLLVKRNAAYLAPVEAFEDAFDDLRNHQIATLAGMRVAFESMLAEFDPDRLQEQFDRQLKRGSLLGVPAKLRYWDLFRTRHHDMVKDPDASFRKLFGEEFARASEEQLDPDQEPEYVTTTRELILGPRAYRLRETLTSLLDANVCP